MKGTRQKKNIFLLIIFFASGTWLSAQEGVDSLQYPETNEDIIYIEGESAVSTNFALEPTLDYGASGSRTLQLNRSLGLQEGSPFFAEYVFYVEDGGTYRLWYGGTPPGPEQDLFPSYSSPFTLLIDGEPEEQFYNENVSVREQYLPHYYWNRLDADFELSKGVHTVQFQVTEKRRFDGKFVFYIDSLFFVREEAAENPEGPLPKVFPSSLAGESDITFQTIADYEQQLSAAPENPGPYLSLSNIYSLVGDYINALKILRQLRLLYPENPEYLVLSAKTRLWKGDVQEGLRLYRQALSIAPEKIDTWTEAGKVAAWSGNYQESIRFFTDGLEYHPDDLGLLVNLGITHLWKSEEETAEIYFSKAEKSAKESLESLLLLAEIYRVNGYPLRAEQVYLEGIKQHPLALELYLELIEVYTARGMEEKAEAVFENITETIPSTDRLTNYLDTFRFKQQLRDKAIEDYQNKVAESPDNIDLRRLLVQTYFWNGRRKEAIREYLYILTNYAFRASIDLYENSTELYRTMDVAYTYEGFYLRLQESLNDRIREISTFLKELLKAEKEYTALRNQEDLSEEDIAKARQEVTESRKKTGTAISDLQALLDRAVSYQFSYNEGTEGIDSIVEREKQDAERYESIFDETDWAWDREFHVAELRQTLREEKELAGHVLGAIYKIENKLQTAKTLFTTGLSTDNPYAATAAELFETLLWQGNWEEADAFLRENRDSITEYADHLPAIIDLFEMLQTEEETISTASSLEDLQARFNELNAALEETKPVITEMIQTIGNDIETLREVLSNRLVRKFYTLETNTYLLRYELGKYYIAEEQYVKATAQLEKVLAIDPWNLDAQFRLGVVRQRYGDWKQAMRIYRKIYNQDPYYPNAAAYYNLLARQHPGRFSVDTQLLGDTSRIAFSGDLRFQTAVTTSLAWEGVYRFDGIRLYKTYGGEEPSSHQIHYAGLRFPIDLYFIHLTLTPGAGLYVSSELFRENALSTSDSILPMGYFLTLWDVTPAVSGTVSFRPENLSLAFSYNWEPVEETFVPERTLLKQHTLAVNGYTSLKGLDIPLFEYSSARIDGKLRLIEDSNVIGNALESFDFGIHLFDRPWTTLIIRETVSFEHSKTPSGISDNGYYAPEGVLLVKGGLTGSAWVPIMNQNVLGIIIGASAGGYWEKITSPNPDPAALQLEFIGRTELAKGTSSYYLSVSGSQTFLPAAGEVLYWSLSVNVGISARPTTLLAP